MLESEIFGHKAGSFTGALKDARGLFEEASGGTIFLDESGEMAFDLQAKLLRVLECGEFLRVGDTKPTRVDVRIIAATNRDLAKEIEEGRFREDLFYRLSVFQILFIGFYKVLKINQSTWSDVFWHEIGGGEIRESIRFFVPPARNPSAERHLTGMRHRPRLLLINKTYE